MEIAYITFVAGVEIKVDVHDLANDSKLAAYLNYCHLFYLAVPVVLVTEAIQKIARTPALTGCGLLVATGSVVEVDHTPNLRRPTHRCLSEIYAELLIQPFKVAKKSQKLFVEFV